MNRSDSFSLPLTPVRRSVYEFIPELQYIDINQENIRRLACETADSKFALPDWRMPVFPDDEKGSISESDVIDFIFIGNSINFQFRNHKSTKQFTAEYDGSVWTGAFGMWACLKREFDRNPAIIKGSTLADLTLNDIQEMFEPAGDVKIPMLSERLKILNKIGQRLHRDYDDRFANLVHEAEPRLYSSGNGILDVLGDNFQSYKDRDIIQVTDNTAHEVVFSKRAQLAAGMAFGRFADSGSFEIEDPESFTVFADYNLPNVLHGLDILEYSLDLQKTIDNRQVLERGERAEVELRAATIYASDLLLKAINNRRDSMIYGPHLDYKLFNMRENFDTPVHLANTTAY